ncbi:type II secretion system F family protein [soil metagenome]
MSLTLETLVPFAAFLAISLGAWGTLSVLARRSSDAEDRLRRLMDRARQGKGSSAQLIKKQDRIQKRFTDAANKLAGAVQPKDEASIGKIRATLINAGFRQQSALQIFMTLKLIGLLIGLGIAIPPVLMQIGLTTKGFGIILMVGAFGYILPGFVVERIKKKRQEAIFLGLPDALDLMVVCVEAGLGFDAAMRRVTVELASAFTVLCEELNIYNFQVQMGRPRKEVLRDLGLRTGVDDVRTLAAVIIQAERFGSSIGSALRVQSDAMRTRRRQLAEERAAKTAVKIMIPLILFIFPGVFVVLVGPAGIKIAETMIK